MESLPAQHASSYYETRLIEVEKGIIELVSQEKIERTAKEILAAVETLENQLFEIQPKTLQSIATLHPRIKIRNTVAANELKKEREKYRVTDQKSTPITNFPELLNEYIHPGISVTIEVKNFDSLHGAEETFKDQEFHRALLRHISNELWLQQPLQTVTNADWRHRLGYINRALGQQMNYFDDRKLFHYRSADCVVRITRPPNIPKARVRDNLKYAIGADHATDRVLSGSDEVPSILKKMEAGTLQAHDKEIFDKHFIVPSSFLNIIEEMNTLFTDLKKRLERNDDPISIAAEWHVRAVRIWPWPTKNKSTARVWMNILLMQAGIPPVIFKSAKAYEKAINVDRHLGGTFGYFLRKTIRDS